MAYLGSHSALVVYFRKDKSIVVCKHLVVLCVIELLQLRSQCVRNNARKRRAHESTGKTELPIQADLGSGDENLRI